MIKMNKSGKKMWKLFCLRPVTRSDIRKQKAPRNFINYDCVSRLSFKMSFCSCVLGCISLFMLLLVTAVLSQHSTYNNYFVWLTFCSCFRVFVLCKCVNVNDNVNDVK